MNLPNSFVIAFTILPRSFLELKKILINNSESKHTDTDKIITQIWKDMCAPNDPITTTQQTLVIRDMTYGNYEGFPDYLEIVDNTIDWIKYYKQCFRIAENIVSSFFQEHKDKTIYYFKYEDTKALNIIADIDLFQKIPHLKFICG